MDRFSVKCFGVGDGWPCADRNHSSFLYRLGPVALLIDCGEPLSRSFKASGCDYNGIDGIFLSHLHFDHVGGFFMFLQGLWLERRQRPLAVYLPGHGIDPIRRMLEAGCLFEELLPFTIRWEPLAAGRPIVSRDVQITPFESTHLEGMRRRFDDRYPGRYQAFCFLIESETVRIGHSADLGAPEDLAPLLRQPLDLLVCELAHFQAEDLFRYLAPHSIRHLVLTHLGRPQWERLDQTRALAEKLPIPVTFATDQQELRF